MKHVLSTSLLLALLGTACSTTHSDSAHDHSGQQNKQASMEEMMGAMERAGTPGAEHKRMEPLIGTWNAKVSMYMDPAAPAMESTGTMVNEWIYGGRYLHHHYSGQMEGMSFEGSGLMGYDVAAGKYIGSWIDSMSTTMSVSSGHASKDGKTFTFVGHATDPMTGKHATNEEVISIDGPDRHTMAMYEKRGDKRVKTMEIVYTRAK